MNQNELIQQAFDAKYTEIGEAAWHDISADKIFEYGWTAYLAAQPIKVTDLTTKLRQLPRSENMANRHAEVMLNAAAEIERYYGGMMAWKQTAETRDRQLAEAMEKRVTERVEARLAQAQQEPSAELKEMEARKDAAYLERNQVVAALAKCFPSGTAKTAIEGWSEDWHGCVYIDLPTGQASWHYHNSQAYLFADLPEYRGKWDGHTTEEKYLRIAKLQSQAPQTEEYAEGQWWLKELDDLVKDGTPDQKRAVYGVVRKLMQEVNAIEKPNYRYFIREIGEGDWQEVSYSMYADSAGSPLIDYKREQVEQ